MIWKFKRCPSTGFQVFKLQGLQVALKNSIIVRKHFQEFSTVLVVILWNTCEQ